MSAQDDERTAHLVGLRARQQAMDAARASAPDARRLVDEQAKDEAIWFAAVNASEAYLQQALRALHAAVERETGGETGPFAPDARGEASDLRTLAAALVAKLDAVAPYLSSQAALAYVHGARYDGPNYGEELAALRAALAAAPPDSLRDTLEEP